jgi:protein-arginine kinase activator protein McsA
VAHPPKLPEVANLCRRCHERDAAKPKNFPQVATAEHSGGMACNNCHQPHNPHL